MRRGQVQHVSECRAEGEDMSEGTYPDESNRREKERERRAGRGEGG